MTIKITHESIALLRPSDFAPSQCKRKSPSSSLNHWFITGEQGISHQAEHDDNLQLSHHRILYPDGSSNGPALPLCDKESNLVLEDLSIDSYCADDDDSIESCSVTSNTLNKSVTFAETLITAVYTRPYTLPEDREALFYTVDDTLRFRREYRLEKKHKVQFLTDPALVQVNETNGYEFESQSSNHDRYRHSISRVVVQHNNAVETFYDQHLSCLAQHGKHNSKDQVEKSVDDFFDNDSFWSGSITWF